MTRIPCTCTLVTSLLLSSACGDDVSSSASASATAATGATSATTATAGTGSTSEGTMSGGSAPTSEGSASASDTAGTSGTSGSVDPTTSTSGGFPKLDVGAEETTGDSTEGGEKGCKKVDFLFIIDNSGSMGNEQQSLIASFPGFIKSIQDTLHAAQDYHIMVIDTDAWVFSGCELICGFFGSCFPANPDYVCGSSPLECEDVLGAGVVHPRGLQASEQDCMFTSGFRYMDTSEPDLAATFACAAQVGVGSTDDPEKPMEAMVQAVAPNGPAHDCNTGFIREDAILVVTFVTDEDDNFGDGSAGTPEGWKASLVAAKKGDENALVVLGLFGDNDQPNAICSPLNTDSNSGAEPSPRLRQFVELFGDRGFSGSICAPSYDPFFAEAVSIIDSTCDDFVPPT